MVMRRSEFVFILLAAAAVFFILGYYVSNRNNGQTFTVSAETSASTASSPSPAGQLSSAEDAGGSSERDEASLPGPLNINSASADELAGLPGMDLSAAEAIVRFREECGPFDYTERLLSVSGIDRELYLGIEQYIYAG